MDTTTTTSFLPKFFFRALAVVGLVCLLVVGNISSGRTRQEATQRSSEILEHEKVMGRDNKHVSNEELGFNYMSKRKVPNGPDPIHNRRAGNSGRPPGKA